MGRKNFRTICHSSVLNMISTNQTLLEEIKKIKQIYNTPGNGYFAVEELYPKALNWQNCREKLLANFLNKSRGLFFTHYNNLSEDIATFITKCENILQNSNEEIKFKYTLFKKTNYKNITWIKPSEFWLDCIFKKSLFTLLLRCSLNYKTTNNNFDECMFSEKYEENKLARETKDAILRFFYGFTEYKGNQHVTVNIENTSIIKQGWHFEFQNRTLCYLKQVLQKPLNYKSKNISGTNTLWN